VPEVTGKPGMKYKKAPTGFIVFPLQLTFRRIHPIPRQVLRLSQQVNLKNNNLMVNVFRTISGKFDGRYRKRKGPPGF